MPIARRRWVSWGSAFACLIVLTLLMRLGRGTLDKAHVALLYLMLVLAGSAWGGRALGVALAGGAFLAFNIFFLPPYGTLIIANPLDWLVLAAFLLASLIAAQLLARFQAEAEAARRRAAEVERFSALGSEALNVVRAEDALQAIADVIRTTVEIDQCDIYIRRDVEAEPALGAHSGRAVVDVAPGAATAAPSGGHSLLAWVATHSVAAAERVDRTLHVPALPRADMHDASEPHGVPWEEFPGVRVLTVPLRVRDRTVGVLRLAHESGLPLAPQQHRFLDALIYYAALGVERARLAAEAESVAAMREADRLKNALLAAVSHDLRTPLTTIKALAHDAGAHGAAAGDTRLASIEEEANHLTVLVADLLDLSRLAGGALRLDIAVNTAEDLIGTAVNRTSGILGTHPLQIVRDDAAPVLVGRFDFAQSLRALVNLIENAAKYSPAGAPIELEAFEEGGMLVFAVSDRGPGVVEPERKRIFEPFYRPAGVPPDVRGAGLGLAIARGLAEAQGGAIRYMPRESGGSVFALVLPVAEAPPAILSKL